MLASFGPPSSSAMRPRLQASPQSECNRDILKLAERACRSAGTSPAPERHPAEGGLVLIAWTDWRFPSTSGMGQPWSIGLIPADGVAAAPRLENRSRAAGPARASALTAMVGRPEPADSELVLATVAHGRPRGVSRRLVRRHQSMVRSGVASPRRGDHALADDLPRRRSLRVAKPRSFRFDAASRPGLPHRLQRVALRSAQAPRGLLEDRGDCARAEEPASAVTAAERIDLERALDRCQTASAPPCPRATTRTSPRGSRRAIASRSAP